MLATIVQVSLGTYYADILTDMAGQWKWRLKSTTPSAAEEGSFLVRKSVVDS